MRVINFWPSLPRMFVWADRIGWAASRQWGGSGCFSAHGGVRTGMRSFAVLSAGAGLLLLHQLLGLLVDPGRQVVRAPHIAT